MTTSSERLPRETRASIRVNASVSHDLQLLSQGAYDPLMGFMDRENYEAVVETLRTVDGAVFPLPIVLPVHAEVACRLGAGDLLGVSDSLGLQAAIMVTDVFWRDLGREALKVYGTRSLDHPGVERLMASSPWCVAGSVTVMKLPPAPHPEPFTPHQVKALMAQRGWSTMAAFQTRNPTHRAHEYLLKMALEITDGLLLHPLVGPTKTDDVDALTRMASYRTLLKGYFPPERVLLATFGAAMRYAGPREAVFHGLVRRNYGATHFIMGRDAAGVGNFYGPNDARGLFESLAEQIGIVPLTFDQIGFCPRCHGMASGRSCPHVSEWRAMSGAAVRQLLRQGVRPPEEIMRPEVADILMARGLE